MEHGAHEVDARFVIRRLDVDDVLLSALNGALVDPDVLQRRRRVVGVRGDDTQHGAWRNRSLRIAERHRVAGVVAHVDEADFPEALFGVLGDGDVPDVAIRIALTLRGKSLERFPGRAADRA